MRNNILQRCKGAKQWDFINVNISSEVVQFAMKAATDRKAARFIGKLLNGNLI